MLALLEVEPLVDLLFQVLAMTKCEAETGLRRAFGGRSRFNVEMFVVRGLGTWPTGLYRKGAVRQRKSGDGGRGLERAQVE